MYNMLNTNQFIDKEVSMSMLTGADEKGLKPKLASENSDYQLIRDDIISVEPVSVELKWDMTEKEFDEYEKVARRLIRSNKEFRDESLRRFMKRNNILIYPLDKMIQLLKYKNNGRMPDFQWLSKAERYSELFHGEDIRLEKLIIYKYGSVFSNFIPRRVIEKINFILRKFPELYCFISNNNVCQEAFVIVIFGHVSEVFVVDMWHKNESAVVGKEK